MMTQGKKMIKKDDWMVILFIKPSHNIKLLENIVTVLKNRTKSTTKVLKVLLYCLIPF